MNGNRLQGLRLRTQVCSVTMTSTQKGGDMNRVPQTMALGVGAVVALLFGVGQPVGGPARADAALRASLARLPLSFVVNRGQLDRRVAFAVQGRDASALSGNWTLVCHPEMTKAYSGVAVPPTSA